MSQFDDPRERPRDITLAALQPPVGAATKQDPPPTGAPYYTGEKEGVGHLYDGVSPLPDELGTLDDCHGFFQSARAVIETLPVYLEADGQDTVDLRLFRKKIQAAIGKICSKPSQK